MSNELLDAKRCPLCGSPNACGMAAGDRTCWCYDATLEPGVLDRVPPEARGVVCVCRACGTRETALVDVETDYARRREGG